MLETKLGKIVPLTPVLESGEILFLDSGFFSRGHSFFQNLLYGKERFHQLDSHGLQLLNAVLSKSVRYLSFPHTFSTPKVVQEMERTVDMLANKWFYLIRQENRNQTQRWKPHGPQEGRSRYGKDLLSRACAYYREIAQRTRTSLFPVQDAETFETLERAIIQIGEKSKAKINYATGEEKARQSKRVDLHTDEQLVAAAMYISLIEQAPCSIVSADSDIQRLVVQTQIYFGEHPDLGRVSRALIDHPVSVYFVSGEHTAECKVDTSQPDSFRYAYASRRERDILFK